MAQLRELRNRIRSVKSIRKITKAQELIATSRIMKAQARVEASRPYADEITRVMSAVAGASTLDHPLLTERSEPKRAAVLVVTSDGGFCGAYNANVLREAEELQSLLRSEGKTPVLYVIGPQGRGVLPVPQPGDRQELGGVLGPSGVRQCRRRRRDPGQGVPRGRRRLPRRRR